MPYNSNEDLPPSVRHALPSHAQDIYRAAFNNAWSTWLRHGGLDEASIHRIAWGAVKRHYEKVDGQWVPKHPHRAN